MRRIGLSIENISTGAIFNSRWASEEGSHAILILLGNFDAFAGRAEVLNNSGGDISLVLGKAEVEMKVGFFLTNTGVHVYAVGLTDESEEGESAGSIIEFFWIDVNSISRHIEKLYFL